LSFRYKVPTTVTRTYSNRSKYGFTHSNSDGA
jgi:hypothetical protein